MQGYCPIDDFVGSREKHRAVLKRCIDSNVVAKETTKRAEDEKMSFTGLWVRKMLTCCCCCCGKNLTWRAAKGIDYVAER